ncbi:MAG: DUF4465 domain-containing protein [Paludibacteraceae bacterium]|nr:DUF4465 domain-containing protein [Paludibacteraceae bacterium]
MKRLFLLILAACSLLASAEVITMDLTTATDLLANPVTYSTSYGDGYYDCTDVWDSTYNDSGFCQFIYTNDARFMLSHMPSMMSYGGMSWEGFTLSKVSQDTANVFGCVANGGLVGVATPYIIGYYSEWVTEAQGFSSNIILFDQEYYPECVYICQNSNTMEAIANGNVFNARPFAENDTLALIISALNVSLEETQSLTYYLAVDGEKNNGWVKVPLTALGKTSGLSFRMTTTDTGDFGSNTPLYFALDALTINTEQPTAVENLPVLQEEATKIWYQGYMYILRQGTIYNLQGDNCSMF